MLVSKYLVLIATKGTAPCAHPWQTKAERQGRKGKRIRKRRKSQEEKQGKGEEVIRDAIKEHYYPVWWIYIFLDSLCFQLCLADLLSTNAKYKPILWLPICSFKASWWFLGDTALSILKAQVPHFSMAFITTTRYAQKPLWWFLLLPTIFFLIPRTWNFCLLKIFREDEILTSLTLV